MLPCGYQDTGPRESKPDAARHRGRGVQYVGFVRPQRLSCTTIIIPVDLQQPRGTAISRLPAVVAVLLSRQRWHAAWPWVALATHCCCCSQRGWGVAPPLAPFAPASQRSATALTANLFCAHHPSPPEQRGQRVAPCCRGERAAPRREWGRGTQRGCRPPWIWCHGTPLHPSSRAGALLAGTFTTACPRSSG